MEPDETKERRRSLRFPVALPLNAKGWIEDGTAWEEDTTTDDVCEGGLSFILGREVRLGQVLRIRVPFPRRLRPFGRDDQELTAFTLVRRITRESASCRVGVMFFGPEPPRGFLDRPFARFLLPSDRPETEPPRPVEPDEDPADSMPEPDAWRAVFPDADDTLPDTERRKAPRLRSSTTFALEAQDEWGTVLAEELTTATDISRGGTCLHASVGFRAGEVLLLREAGGDFVTRVSVCAVSKEPSGGALLHVSFLDGEPPSRLLT